MRRTVLKFLSFVIIAVFSLSFIACGEESEFTVSFDADGGTLSFYSKKFELGEDELVPDGNKGGYKLACFVYEYDGSEYVFGQNKFYFRKDITVKAVWAPQEDFIITYHLDGGLFSGKGKYYYSKNDADFTLSTPVKSGYRFLGWKLNGEGEPISEMVIPCGSTGDKAFYAVFEEAKYKVKLNLTCEAVNPVKENVKETVECTYHGQSEMTITVSYGNALELDAAVPKQTEYEFFCWLYYDKNGEFKEFVAQGKDGAIIFNEDNFTYGEEVVLYVYCLPVMSPFI